MSERAGCYPRSYAERTPLPPGYAVEWHANPNAYSEWQKRDKARQAPRKKRAGRLHASWSESQLTEPWAEYTARKQAERRKA